MKPQISQSHENVDDNVFEINGINYKKNEDGKSLSVAQSRTKYNGTVNIPARVTFKDTCFRVTSIGDSAFEDCSGLNFVTIPDTVISIDDWAFEDAQVLQLYLYPIPSPLLAIGLSKIARVCPLSPSPIQLLLLEIRLLKGVRVCPRLLFPILLLLSENLLLKAVRG